MMVVVILVLVAGPALAKTKPAADSENFPIFFAMVADSVSVEGSTLTLNGVPRITWFTDRPERKAGFIPLATFLTAWDADQGFAIDPPNAVLAIPNSLGIDEAIIELKSAVNKDEALIFKFELIKGGLVQGKFGPATLFIDSLLGDVGTGFCSGAKHLDPSTW